METKTYWIEGEITIKVSFEVEATSESEALEKGREEVTADYNLDVYGYNHSPLTDVDIDLEAGEYED